MAARARLRRARGAIAGGAIAPAGPDFEAAGPDFEAAGPDFEAAGPDSAGSTRFRVQTKMLFFPRILHFFLVLNSLYSNFVDV